MSTKEITRESLKEQVLREAMSSRSWFEKYRPKTLDEIVFSEGVPREIITGFYDDSIIKGNILCYGPTGTGKTTLNRVLASKVLQDSTNLLTLGRKIEDIEKLAQDLRYMVRGEDKKRIVMIEEMDKLTPQAQLALKDGLMENFQHSTTFLATTNKPEALDPALLSRFNIRIDFEERPHKGEVFKRLKTILETERVTFKGEDLQRYVESYIDIGLRDMINGMETASYSGTFNPVYKHIEVAQPMIKTKAHRKEIASETKRIWDIYGHSMLSKEELADELNITTRTVDRRIKERISIPHYKKEGTNHIGFPVRAVATYLVEGLVKTA